MSLQLLCMILNYFHTFLLYFLIFLDIDACDFNFFYFYLSHFIHAFCLFTILEWCLMSTLQYFIYIVE